ncbi:MAG: thioredoxin domain-containing protein, partial [Planctomycetota bacterium]
MLGGVALAVGLGASGVLSLRHLGAPLVGCGLDSPCTRALASAFARLPGLGWPVAFLGAGYFAGLTLAWVLVAGAWPRSLAWLVRLGGVAALGFVAAAAWLAAPCPFCLAAQAAGLVFWWASERRCARARAPRAELGCAALFLAVLGGLALAEKRAERGRDAAAQAEVAAAAAQDGPRGFTGRHRIGPERAPLRLVLFVDYRCADCRRIDAEALALVRAHPGLSLSIKHFPLDDDCNRRARTLGRDPHPGACFAARAAEAAALAGGEQAFWRVHAWLFAREQELTSAALERELANLGLAPGSFLEQLHGVEAGARVTADVEEGLALGLEGTPAVFLNGVELREWRVPGALTRAVEALAAAAPPRV